MEEGNVVSLQNNEEEKKLLKVKENKEKRRVEKLLMKIKSFLKSAIFKKSIFILLFFFACYIAMDLLNGNNVLFSKIFSFSTSLNEKANIIKGILIDFFKFPKFICNFAIFIFLYLFVYGITNRTKISCTIVSSTAIVFGIINYIVTQVRGIAITVSDIYSVQTAMNVAKGIKPDFDGNFIVGIALFIIATFILWKFCKFDDKIKTRTIKRRVITTLVGVVCILFFFMLDPLMDDVAIWDINASYANSGAGLALMRMIKDLNVKKPNNYDPDEVRRILASYEDDTMEYEGELPNVLVIMNESFADVQSVFNFEISTDNIPYYHSLLGKENVVSGTMHSSKFGGGTSNVEYEFITQNTTAFLPIGSTPYQQYISRNVNDSIVATMNRLNYNSYGIHSWNQNGYSRGKIYKFLQFKNSLFRENMPNLELSVSDYSSDASTYGYWYDIMKNKPKDERNFSFIVTVQNHLPFHNTIDGAPEYVSDNPDLNSYLQYESLSDDALKDLIEFVEKYDEDVIILFFGDHQPYLGLEDMYGSNGVYSVEESSYVVPFFIWANYDIEEQSDVEISTNYLQDLLFDVGNFPKSSYTKYVSELREEIPIVTTQYYIDKSGNSYKVDDKDSPYYDKLQEYWKIIYYQMFDNK